MQLFLRFVLLACSWMNGTLLAEQYLRPSVAMSEEDLKIWEWTRDEVVRINARFAWIDYEALRRDFPKMKDWPDEKIKTVLERQVFVLGKQQLRLAGLRSSEVTVSPDQADLPKVYRQQDGGRSGVIELRDGSEVLGYLDMKGMGYGENGRDAVEEIVQSFRKSTSLNNDSLLDKDHSDGLMSLGEGIAELTRQRALQRLFDLHNVYATGTRIMQTIDSYFLIDLPFEILRSKGQRLPAGIYGRQAQFVRASQYELRKTPGAGMYADDYGGKQHDGLGAAIDMGAVLITDPRLASTFYGGELAGKPAYQWDDPRYDAQQTKPWRFGHETARAYRAGDQEVVSRHLKDMLAPIEDDWQKIAGKARQVALAAAVQNAEKSLEILREGITWSRLDHFSHSLPPSQALEVVGKFLSDMGNPKTSNVAAIQRALEMLPALTQSAKRCVSEVTGECQIACAAQP